jgi:thiaminase/transcriptional activator TenA
MTTLSDRLRKESQDVWDAYHRHPFVRGIGDGTLPREAFAFYLRQDYAYLIDYARLWSIALARATHVEAMQRCAELVHGTLHIEMEHHRRTCAAFGIPVEELERTVPGPVTLGYASYLLRVAYEGDRGELLAALVPCLWSYREIADRLRANGLPAEEHYRDWIETYAGTEYRQLVDWGRAWLDAEAGRYADTSRLAEVFRTSSRWELLFWQMAWEQATWPG